MNATLLLYGATGYTGRLILEEALAQGLRPVLSGRNAPEVRALAALHGLAARPVGLDDAGALDATLDGVHAVLHCAGPFARLGPPMVAACFRRGVHYLDITGEIAMFEWCAASDEKAKRVGVVVLPGVGFDVVPSDCLAAHLKARLPTATELTLAFTGGTGLSRGTATTMVENLAAGGAIRRDGVIVRVPAAWRARDIDFGDRLRHCVTIPWGDVSTAYHSTNIPNVAVYTALSRGSVRLMRLARPFYPIAGTRLAQRLLKARIASRPSGPSTERRASARSRLWGEVRDPHGGVARARVVAADGYTLTARSAVLAAQQVLAGRVEAGFRTPSSAFGKDFILAVRGSEREDLD